MSGICLFLHSCFPKWISLCTSFRLVGSHYLDCKVSSLCLSELITLDKAPNAETSWPAGRDQQIVRTWHMYTYHKRQNYHFCKPPINNLCIRFILFTFNQLKTIFRSLFIMNFFEVDVGQLISVFRQCINNLWSSHSVGR